MKSQGMKLGFTHFSEAWNGRLAMLGFIIGVATELLDGSRDSVSTGIDVIRRQSVLPDRFDGSTGLPSYPHLSISSRKF